MWYRVLWYIVMWYRVLWYRVLWCRVLSTFHLSVSLYPVIGELHHCGRGCTTYDVGLYCPRYGAVVSMPWGCTVHHVGLYWL